MAKLTAVSVDNWKKADRRQEVPDAATPGLYLVVQPSGKKSWTVRYRNGAKHRRMSLGRFPAVTLADARAKAREVQAAAAEGHDPAGEREHQRAERIDARLSERDRVKTLFTQYAKRHLASLKSGAVVERELQRHVVDRWGDRDIHEITRRDVLDLLDEIADSGRVVTANRVRAYLNKFLSWCVERDVIDASPAMGVKPVAKERSRDRVLSDEEICWLWRACEDLGQPWGPLGQTLLLTGQRLGEVVGMTDAEINGDEWHLPAARTKNGRAHVVPLSPAAQDVLRAMERIEGRAGLYHTTTGETPLSGFNRGRDRIAKRMEEIAATERGGSITIPRWTFHDLRRTAATGMARLGQPVAVVEAVLNHVSGAVSGVAGVYNRHAYSDEKRIALEAWSRFVADLVNDQAAGENVVPITMRS